MMSGSVVLKEDDLDCDIIDVLVLSPPCLNCFLLEYLNSFLCVVVNKRRDN